MNIKGELLIGADAVIGVEQPFNAINPATNEVLEPVFFGGNEADVDRAAILAWEAFDTFRETTLSQRAAFLEEIAEQIMLMGDELIDRGVAETGLPRARLEGERARTVNQLKLFAKVVRLGKWLDIRIDEAMPDRQPLPRSDLRMRHIALGPVAVFGASNFPLAFSVAGGDTASALAAGCPVIVKGHSAHPGVSELVGRAIQSAVKVSGLPEGVFSLLFGSGRQVGAELVRHPYIKAVGFTGSQAGGTALMDIAAKRPEPIPVYAEMASINPVFLLPEALKHRSETIAKGFVGSLTMHAGQFCTNPGLVIAIESEGLQNFLATAAEEIKGVASHTMLTPGIQQAYCEGVDQLNQHPSVSLVAVGEAAVGENQCQAGLYTTSADDFMADETLGIEVFGASSLVVICQTWQQVIEVAEKLEGQLTATLQLDDDDLASARELLPVLERKAGRILCNGFPTGVEVCDAMVHGGPYPATSDSRSTSVGSAAIQRFIRPVCYQDLPNGLLPNQLRTINPFNVPRLINGQIDNY